MSLPERVQYFDKNGKVIHEEYVNIGWHIERFAWRDLVLDLPIVYKAVMINCYDITFPQKWIIKQDKRLLMDLYTDLDNCEKAKRNKDGSKDPWVFPYLQRLKRPKSQEVSNRTKDLQKVLLPMIRNIMPTAIAHEIVGVQPMTEAISLFDSKWNLKIRRTNPRVEKIKRLWYKTRVFGTSFFKYHFPSV